MEYKHIPVLLDETIEGLNVKPDGIYVDGTLGRGGHSSEVLKKLTTGHLYCFDQDIQAINESKPRLEQISNKFTLINNNFKNMKEELNKLGIEKVDGIMFDLGVSSAQFDEQDRGFSYRFDARLDMRMNQQATLSAYDVVNNYSLQELTKIIRDYGEDKFAYQIAKEIIKSREIKPIETTFELVDVIKKALPNKVLSKVGHPAKQTFQAIRIEVNDELNVLKEALKSTVSLLKSKGRMCVITFNSLEDRIVKDFFNSLAKEVQSSRRLPVQQIELDYSLVNRKVIIATDEELEKNNRAKSAKLRILERK
ncbi:MAG: 16S rRNA (cytosine(1402)-N(4))-methyltransferase RsmH [Erysipelotrichaceae bacterium]|nr:16S rRNA (cytosine(1402)-N(4))-methyltransferase RsmH [Erysipelotrichaceae bacterium]